MRPVRVLYFAALRDLCGTSEESLDLPGEVVDVTGFVAFIVRARPELAGRLGSTRVAVNEAFAAGSDAVRAGDVIALIPPVAGG